MSLFARFRAIDEDGKAHAVRRLIESSTPDFDYFYMVTLAVAMAALGLLLDSVAIVIGSMLIAPVLFPLLSFSLGLVMSDYRVLTRSLGTLARSVALGIGISVIATVLMFVFVSDPTLNEEIISRTEPSLLYLLVAIVAGLAASFALARPDWNETLPGIAISVALIPPLATVGIGIAQLDLAITIGASVLLIINFVGIITASMVSFSLMNLYEKRHIATSTIEKEEEKVQEVNDAVEEFEEEERKRIHENTQKGEKQSRKSGA